MVSDTIFCYHGGMIVLSLLVLGVLSRFVPHPWNATPLTAIALFGGTFLSKRWSLILPLGAVMLSDVVLGWHNTMPFTWGAFALTGLLAWWVRQRPSLGRIAAGTIVGSVLFFLITNFGVWLIGGLYPSTVLGLRECYVAGLPFFRNMLVGDLAYSGALFGGYALATSRLSAPARSS